MISLLITLLILCLIFGIVCWVLQMLPVPHPFNVIAMAIIGLIFILVLISLLMGGLPFHPIRLP